MRIRSLESMKSLIYQTRRETQKPAEVARVLRGTRFKAGRSHTDQVVVARLLGQVSPLGKLQAVLACAVQGCHREHVREQSDWHQSIRCPAHLHTKE